jgi:hypothetical protein
MLEILDRNYIPVDLVLANTAIAHVGYCDLERDVATHRASLPLLRMSAFVESGVIRVEVCGRHASSDSAPQPGVVEAVLGALGKNRVDSHAHA